MPDSTDDLANSLGSARIGDRRRLLLGWTGAALALAVAGLALTSRGTSHRVVTVEATPVAAAAATPGFCPAARAYVDKLPLIQASLSDPSKLPGLLTATAPGIAAPITSAPAAVQSDLGTITKAIGDLQAAMATTGNQLARLSPQQAMALESPTTSQAIARLLEYVNATCG